MKLSTLTNLSWVVLLMSISFKAVGQDEANKEKDVLRSQQEYEAPLTIDLDGDEEDKPIELKEKKVKKKVYYGKKTRKGWTRTRSGNDIVWEQFFILKEYEEPVPYVRDVYTFDYKKRKIVKSRSFDPKTSGVLHGPYKKLLGDQVIEEGIYYLGVKHGRWMRWNTHDILVEKEKYYKGWPKESLIAYHNKEDKQIREVIPVHFGDKEGNYLAFHPSGRIAVMGEYQFDNKVGIWREFYDQDNRRKREILYPDRPFDEEFQPHIVREWDERGKLIYERKTQKK